MEALNDTNQAANGNSGSAEFSMLQATIKSFLSQAKQLNTTQNSSSNNWQQ